MHLPRLTHIALHVEDIDACIAFYQQFCGMAISHQRSAEKAWGQQRIVWMSEPGREEDFVLVMMNGGRNLALPKDDYRHFGFAVDSREAVEQIADQAREQDCLLWEPVDEPYPVGYYCGLRDPNGNSVEFSYGQPLGPGAP